MAYTILNTDGTILARVVDATINTTATSVTLVGRDYTGFGQYYNQNLVTLLSNSALNTPPIQPIKGELWYDTVNKKIKVYDGSFSNVGAVTMSDTVPTQIASGDFWYDSANQGMNFISPYGTISFPSYLRGSPTGWVTPLVEIIDSTSVVQDQVTLLYNKDPSTAIGVLSLNTFVASTESTQRFLTASSAVNASIVSGLTIFGSARINDDVIVGGKLQTAATTGTPANTTTPTSWLKIVVGGANFYVPLYQ